MLDVPNSIGKEADVNSEFAAAMKVAKPGQIPPGGRIRETWERPLTCRGERAVIAVLTAQG
jgi:hypothetical protein